MSESTTEVSGGGAISDEELQKRVQRWRGVYAVDGIGKVAEDELPPDIEYFVARIIDAESNASASEARAEAAEAEGDERDFLIAWLVTILQDGESVTDMLEATMQLAGEDNLSESQQNALAAAILSADAQPQPTPPRKAAQNAELAAAEAHCPHGAMGWCSDCQAKYGPLDAQPQPTPSPEEGK